MLTIDLINDIIDYMDNESIYKLIELDKNILKNLNKNRYNNLYHIDNDNKTVNLIIKFIKEEKLENLLNVLDKVKIIDSVIKNLFLLLIISYGSESFLNKIINQNIVFEVYTKKINYKIEYIGLEYLFLKMRNLKTLEDKEFDIIFYLYCDGLTFLSNIWSDFKRNIYNIKVIHNRYYMYLNRIYTNKIKYNGTLKYLLPY